jgi:hypothetical protein
VSTGLCYLKTDQGGGYVERYIHVKCLINLQERLSGSYRIMRLQVLVKDLQLCNCRAGYCL